MNGRLLDTNIVIAFFANDKVVEQAVARVKPVSVPAIVLGELYSGARKSGLVEQNLARIDEFASGVKVLSCDLETARQYGIIRQALRVIGRPIPEHDVWIAAVAIQHDLTLVLRGGNSPSVYAAKGRPV